MHIVDCYFLGKVYVNDILISDFKDFKILILIKLLIIHVNCYWIMNFIFDRASDLYLCSSVTKNCELYYFLKMVN